MNRQAESADFDWTRDVPEFDFAKIAATIEGVKDAQIVATGVLCALLMEEATRHAVSKQELRISIDAPRSRQELLEHWKHLEVHYRGLKPEETFRRGPTISRGT